jgi:hypothetical protein
MQLPVTKTSWQSNSVKTLEHSSYICDKSIYDFDLFLKVKGPLAWKSLWGSNIQEALGWNAHIWRKSKSAVAFIAIHKQNMLDTCAGNTEKFVSFGWRLIKTSLYKTIFLTLVVFMSCLQNFTSPSLVIH